MKKRGNIGKVFVFVLLGLFLISFVVGQNNLGIGKPPSANSELPLVSHNVEDIRVDLTPTTATDLQSWIEESYTTWTVGSHDVWHKAQDISVTIGTDIISLQNYLEGDKTPATFWSNSFNVPLHTASEIIVDLTTAISLQDWINSRESGSDTTPAEPGTKWTFTIPAGSSSDWETDNEACYIDRTTNLNIKYSRGYALAEDEVVVSTTGSTPLTAGTYQITCDGGKNYNKFTIGSDYETIHSVIKSHRIGSKWDWFKCKADYSGKDTYHYEISLKTNGNLNAQTRRGCDTNNALIWHQVNGVSYCANENYNYYCPVYEYESSCPLQFSDMESMYNWPKVTCEITTSVPDASNGAETVCTSDTQCSGTTPVCNIEKGSCEAAEETTNPCLNKTSCSEQLACVHPNFGSFDLERSCKSENNLGCAAGLAIIRPNFGSFDLERSCKDETNPGCVTGLAKIRPNFGSFDLERSCKDEATAGCVAGVAELNPNFGSFDLERSC